MKFPKNQPVHPISPTLPLPDQSPLPAKSGATKRPLGAMIVQVAPRGDFDQTELLKGMVAHQPDRAGGKAFAPLLFFPDQKSNFGRPVAPVDRPQLDIPDMTPASTLENSQQEGSRVMIGPADQGPKLTDAARGVKTNFQKCIYSWVPKPTQVGRAAIPGGQAT